MRHIRLRVALGISATSFGAGILLSFILSGYLLAFIEAAALVAAGLLLLGNHHLKGQKLYEDRTFSLAHLSRSAAEKIFWNKKGKIALPDRGAGDSSQA